MNENKLNYVEAAFLIVIVMISHIILEFPNLIIKSIGSSSILNVVYITLLALLFFFIVAKLFKPHGGKNILNISEYIGGKALKYIMTIIYSLHFIFVAAILIRSFSETLQVVYFPSAPIWIIIAMFLIVAIIVNKLGSKNVIRANTLLIPPILITMVIVFISSINNFEFNRIFPLLGNGIDSTFIKGASNIYTFSGLIYIFFIIPELKNINDFKKVGITAILLSGAYLLFSVSSLLMLFPFLTSGVDVLSVYLSTRTIQLGKFMPRTDAIFMFIWILNYLTYLSVIILYISKISKDSFKVKNSSPIIYLSAILIFIISLIPKNSVELSFIQIHVFKYMSLIIVFGLSFLILLIGYLKKQRVKVSIKLPSKFNKSNTS